MAGGCERPPAMAPTRVIPPDTKNLPRLGTAPPRNLMRAKMMAM